MIFPTLEQYARAKGAATRVPRVILPYHRKMYAAITSWAAGTLPGGARNLAITIPPRHGKTLAAHDTVEWLFGMVPESRWLYTAYSADLAVSQTMRIRDALVSDWYRRMFPDTQVRGNRQNFVTTAAGGELYGVGMTGRLPGLVPGGSAGSLEGPSSSTIPFPPKSHAARPDAPTSTNGTRRRLKAAATTTEPRSCSSCSVCIPKTSLGMCSLPNRDCGAC